jgi:hypothetical protein
MNETKIAVCTVERGNECIRVCIIVSLSQAGEEECDNEEPEGG